MTPEEKRLELHATLVRLLRVGRGSMPAYEGLLREHQLLDVIAYLRTLHQ